MSASMYDFLGGVAREFVPGDAEVAQRLAKLRQHYLAGDYAAQKQELDADNEGRSIDLFVATFALWKPEGEAGLFSACTWTEGVEALLPKTDKVSFVCLDEAGQPRHAGIVAWEQVEAVAGHLMEVEPGSYPVRYRVAAFPELGSVGLR